MCHAAFQQNNLPPAACPVSPLIVHLQYSDPSAAHYSWLRQALDATFDTHVARLGALITSPLAKNATYAAQAAEETAGALAESVVPQGPNADVPMAAAAFLQRLIDRFPALLFSQSMIASALQAVADAEARQVGAPGVIGAFSGPEASLARTTMLKVVQQAAAAAPGPAEAVLVEHTRHLAGKGGNHAAIAVRFTPEVMQAVHAGRLLCSLPDVSGPYKGIVAWSMKVHALGAVSGLEAAGLDGDVVGQATAALLDAIKFAAPDAQLAAKLVDTAAAVVRHQGSPVVPAAVQLLAWSPLARFSLPVIQAASMAWHWLLAAVDSDVQRSLLNEIIAAWKASQQKGLGLFASKASGATQDAEGTKDTQHGIAVHHAWVVFFAEVWRARRHDVAIGNSAIHSTYAELVGSSICCSSNSLTMNPASAAARFRLLKLALSYVCQAARAKPTDKIGDLSPVEAYRCIVRMALDWFANAVAWHEDTKEFSHEAAAAVFDLAALLRKAPSLVPADPALDELNNALTAADTTLLQLLLGAGKHEIALEKLY